MDLDKTCRAICNSNGEVKRPYLILDHNGNSSSFFPHNLRLAVGLSYIAFIMLKYVSFKPQMLKVFMMICCCILSGTFSVFIYILICSLIFNLLMWCSLYFDLHMLTHPHIPERNPPWFMWMMFLMCCWIWLTIILLRIFTPM